jgi:type IV secretion system protein VirB9
MRRYLLIALSPMMLICAFAEEIQSRKIEYGASDVVTVRTKVRFTTLVILPKEETILDFTCGDKEFWTIDGTKNLAYIKPAKPGARTNVNLVTAAGNVYSFILEEVSEKPDVQPDLKLFIQVKEQDVISAIKGEPKFVAAEEIANYRDQVSIAREAATKARAEAAEKIDSSITSFMAEYPAKLKFGYRYPAGKKPFFVDSIWNDGRFTYIRANTRELPALYEIKDGKPSLVNFDYRDSMIIVRKVVGCGYLALGKARLYFRSKETSHDGTY